jgi:polyisoprenyl-teichoic acid--peptidoglycan teichoic acid transferase
VPTGPQNQTTLRLRPFAGALVALAALATLTVGPPGCSSDRPKAPDVVVGVPEETSTSTSGPQVITEPEDEGGSKRAARTGDGPFVTGRGSGRNQPEPPPRPGLAAADGAPWPAAIPFTSDQVVPDDLVFILVAGSDARPGEDLLRSRADSLHLLAVNPKSGQGTLLGFPRDSWVEIPGHGRGKLNSALTVGGPNLLAATVRRLTGLPVDFYVLTGFPGLATMVDELGGVDVEIDRRMNDGASGARFERGWHRFSGAEALAYSRDRNDVANGDFTRSEHQGNLMVAALAKMRADVADDGGVARWAGVLLRHARLDVPLTRLPMLGALARRLDPGRLRNVVAPGRIGSAGGQSVVFLTTGAARLFEDLRADAVVGQAEPGPPPGETTSTSSTPAPSAPSAPPSTADESTTTSTTEPASTTTSSTGPPGTDILG